MILAVDTETTGFVRRGLPEVDLRHPRLVQLGAVLADDDGRVADEVSLVVYPVGFEIPAEAAAVHGISTEQARRDGLPLELVLECLSALAARSSLVVAHNIPFDLSVLRSEYRRVAAVDDLFARLDVLGRIPRFCTMQEGARVDRNGAVGSRRGRWLSLAEVHLRLTGESVDGAHNALRDAHAALRCYVALSRKLQSADWSGVASVPWP